MLCVTGVYLRDQLTHICSCFALECESCEYLLSLFNLYLRTQKLRRSLAAVNLEPSKFSRESLVQVRIYWRVTCTLSRIFSLWFDDTLWPLRLTRCEKWRISQWVCMCVCLRVYCRHRITTGTHTWMWWVMTLQPARDGVPAPGATTIPSESTSQWVLR